MKQASSDFSLNSLLKRLAIQQPSAEQAIYPSWPGLEHSSLAIKRDDLLHPIISGNKWRKLQRSLLVVVQQNIKHLISFGGGFSNHLHALGYCCHQLNIKFTAIVRGDYSVNPTPMLLDLIKWQTDIQYVNKITYQQRDEPDYLIELQIKYPNALIIPEGGSNKLALQGVGEIVSELSQNYDYIVAPVASGGTLAGLINVTRDSPSKILGIGVLKGQGYLEDLVQHLLPQSAHHWSINHNYHFGGYAKSSTELQDFCTDFYQQTQIEIEPIYSAKLFFALKDLLAKGFFPMDSKILALHTGGLQGART
ncbi:pyridoxal-phosphate dependent enzyme [Paraglaciecola sp.]|uniref:1-aminocyclopropane-1-carboxylate deaminase/D-cysteine desulfhydrase n=1 Tax=Paraglaciecola sp. TaxID=1920173 RepID=UPI0030F3C276